MSVIGLPGGVDREEYREGKCYAQVKPGRGLPARRCHRDACVKYRFELVESPLCGQHSRYLEELLRRDVKQALSLLARWSRV